MFAPGIPLNCRRRPVALATAATVAAILLVAPPARASRLSIGNDVQYRCAWQTCEIRVNSVTNASSYYSGYLRFSLWKTAYPYPGYGRLADGHRVAVLPFVLPNGQEYLAPYSAAYDLYSYGDSYPANETTWYTYLVLETYHPAACGDDYDGGYCMADIVLVEATAPAGGYAYTGTGGGGIGPWAGLLLLLAGLGRCLRGRGMRREIALGLPRDIV